MVLRVANARALIIDLRRLWYLQWITTQTDSDNCAIIRVSDYIACTLLVMALKATAWCRVLIAQFEEYFDAALRGESVTVTASESTVAHQQNLKGGVRKLEITTHWHITHTREIFV